MVTVHCRLCGEAVSGSTFASRMKKLREHRKLVHLAAHRRSVKKSLRTKGYLDPRCHDPLKKRGGLIANPQVEKFKDYNALGTIRILKRKKAVDFPELALTAEHKGKYMTDIGGALEAAGFTDEGSGKLVLRTNKFNIFVYI